MGIETKITCDECQADITATGAMPGFRLKLSCESLPQIGASSYAVMVYPPLDHTHYFCGMDCIGVWMSKQTNQYTGKPIIQTQNPLPCNHVFFASKDPSVYAVCEHCGETRPWETKVDNQIKTS